MLSDSEYEARCDYYGFPSRPLSVYRTGDKWKRPTGLEAYTIPKEARPICKHPIADVWRELGQRVYEYLDSVNVMWTTIDPVRFVEAGRAGRGKYPGPLFLWVGVKPGSLSREDAEVAAIGCKKFLEESEITDVEIAFRESLFTRSVAGPQLHNYVPYMDPTGDVRDALTPSLGLRIASEATSHFEGTGGIYICEGGGSDRVFLLTARHVVLPPSEGNNRLYVTKGDTSQPRRNVVLLGDEAIQNVYESATDNIRRQAHKVDFIKDKVKRFGEATGKAQVARSPMGRDPLEEAEEAVETLNEFHGEVSMFWGQTYERILGHIFHSPPISVGTSPKCFTEDWALIELHREKIDWKTFKGNVMYLGNKISPMDFLWQMFQLSRDGPITIPRYPPDHLLQLQGIVTEDELRHPKMLDVNSEECLIVVKNGLSTGVTIGRSSGIESFVREYDKHGNHATSMELAIYSYSHWQKDNTFAQAFSAPGDSGSIIADGNGRIIGLLTGGTAGKTDLIDVTYASPFYWVFNERIKASFPNAYLYPTKAEASSTLGMLARGIRRVASRFSNTGKT